MPKKNRLASRMNQLERLDVPQKSAHEKHDLNPPSNYSIHPKTKASKKKPQQPEKAELPKKEKSKSNKNADSFTNTPAVSVVKSGGIRTHSALIKTLALVIASVYMCFLIYGLISTKYTYDESGNVVPVVYSVKELSALDEYMKFASYFNRFQAAYKLAIEYDAQISDENCNYVDLAMKYRTLLDGTLDKILIDIKAAERDEGYSTLYNGLASASNELAIYLQKIESALYNKDQNSIAEADTQQSILYQNYLVLIDVVADLGSTVRGSNGYIDLEWDPLSYYNQKTEEVISNAKR